MYLIQKIFNTEEEMNKWEMDNFPNRYQEIIYKPDKQDYPVWVRGYYYSEYADYEQIWLVFFPIKELSEHFGE